MGAGTSSGKALRYGSDVTRMRTALAGILNTTARVRVSNPGQTYYMQMSGPNEWTAQWNETSGSKQESFGSRNEAVQFLRKRIGADSTVSVGSETVFQGEKAPKKK